MNSVVAQSKVPPAVNDAPPEAQFTAPNDVDAPPTALAQTTGQ